MLLAFYVALRRLTSHPFRDERGTPGGRKSAFVRCFMGFDISCSNGTAVEAHRLARKASRRREEAQAHEYRVRTGTCGVSFIHVLRAVSARLESPICLFCWTNSWSFIVGANVSFFCVSSLLLLSRPDVSHQVGGHQPAKPADLPTKASY